jgi:GAF domain-containing protein
MKDGELGKVYSDGEVIFREGDEGDRMYAVQSGKVNIMKQTAAGEIVIATLGAGEILGEMALFDRLPRSATAVASGEARILGIDRDPTLVFKIIEAMSRRIRKLDEEFSKLERDRIDILKIFVNIDETCNFVLEEAKNLIHAENGSIMLLDNAGKNLTIRAAFGTDWNPKTYFGIGEGIAGDVLQTGKAELINNVSLDGRYKTGATQINSVLCVPLKGKEANFGVINMSRSTETLFVLDELKLLRSVAIYASIAIENAIIFEKLNTATDAILRHATLLDMWS